MPLPRLKFRNLFSRPPDLGLPRPKKVICVLGMHRSGTSCLTGALQQGGLQLGEHHTWNQHNQKGNRENQPIVDLHDRILKANGGRWDSPPKLCHWRREDYFAAQQILAKVAEQSPFGFKDPRALLALDGWKRLLGQRLLYVGIFRHPDAVADSLLKRNQKLCRKQAYRLWRVYNRRLLAEHARAPFPVLSFDWEEARFNQAVGQLQEQLGLAAPRDAEAVFFTADLRHNCSDAQAELPPRTARIYSELQELVD